MGMGLELGLIFEGTKKKPGMYLGWNLDKTVRKLPDRTVKQLRLSMKIICNGSWFGALVKI